MVPHNTMMAFAKGRLYFAGYGSHRVIELPNVAPIFQINAGIADAWYNPATAGQGFFITVLPDIQQMFLAWFTYDRGRPSEDVTALPGEPGHRWLTAQGPYDGDTANLTIFVAEGGCLTPRSRKP